MTDLMNQCCHSQGPPSLVLDQESWGKTTVNITPNCFWFYPNCAGMTWALAGLPTSSQAEPGILLSWVLLGVWKAKAPHPCLLTCLRAGPHPPSLCYTLRGSTLHLASGMVQRPNQRVALGLSPSLNLMEAAKRRPSLEPKSMASHKDQLLLTWAPGRKCV